VILVAHDRWFLEAVTTAVLELEAGRSTYFPGQWHVWRREKAARALDASKSIERYNADIARLSASSTRSATRSRRRSRRRRS
jgi:ATP-binding cassette subfamily F protein 3